MSTYVYIRRTGKWSNALNYGSEQVALHWLINEVSKEKVKIIRLL